MFDPFKREKTESNKPITGNDFKLLWGNLDKATEVIKEAQIDYKDGDAYFPADPECGGQPIWTECEDGFAKICAPICEPGFFLACVPDGYNPDVCPPGCTDETMYPIGAPQTRNCHIETTLSKKHQMLFDDKIFGFDNNNFHYYHKDMISTLWTITEAELLAIAPIDDASWLYISVSYNGGALELSDGTLFVPYIYSKKYQGRIGAFMILDTDGNILRYWTTPLHPDTYQRNMQVTNEFAAQCVEDTDGKIYISMGGIYYREHDADYSRLAVGICDKNGFLDFFYNPEIQSKLLSGYAMGHSGGVVILGDYVYVGSTDWTNPLTGGYYGRGCITKYHKTTGFIETSFMGPTSGDGMYVGGKMYKINNMIIGIAGWRSQLYVYNSSDYSTRWARIDIYDTVNFGYIGKVPEPYTDNRGTAEDWMTSGFGRDISIHGNFILVSAGNYTPDGYVSPQNIYTEGKVFIYDRNMNFVSELPNNPHLTKSHIENVLISSDRIYTNLQYSNQVRVCDYTNMVE